MRERTPEENALIYVCGLIEHIGRLTLQPRAKIVDIIDSKLQNLYDFSDTYHCEPLDITASEMISEFNIPMGTFDNVSSCLFKVPSSFEIGTAMMRLIMMVSKKDRIKPLTALRRVYHNIITDKISNFNSAAYYHQQLTSIIVINMAILNN